MKASGFLFINFFQQFENNVDTRSFRENELSEGDKNDSASTSPTGIVLLLAWISKILDDLQLFRDLSSLIRSAQVFVNCLC